MPEMQKNMPDDYIFCPYCGVLLQYTESRNETGLPSIRYSIEFGNYHGNIEWIILDQREEKMLLLSKYALDCRQFHTSHADITWETCSLRKWLNGAFIDDAFSTAERNRIQNTTVTADENPKYDTPPGNSTTDQVFLLSITEVNKYFSSNRARQCQGTAYCYAQGAYKAGSGNCWWWLRSPGSTSYDAAAVCYDGSVDDCDSYVCSVDNAVRPALWITLK